MFLFSSVHTYKNLRVFTVICGKEILRPFSKCDVGCREHMSSFGKVHSASSSPPTPTRPVFCAMTCRNPVSRWEPMCYGSVISVSCYLWSRVQSIFVFEMVCAVYFFFSSSPVIVCARWGVSVIFISPALWLSFPLFLFHPFIVSILFFQLVIKYIFSH